MNAVAPTFAATPMTQQLFSNPDALNDVLSRTPTGRLVEASEVAQCIAFLASPATHSITGSTLMIDGGWTAQ